MKVPPKKVFIMAGMFIAYLAFAFSALGQTYFSPGSLTIAHAKVAKKCTFCHQPFKGTPNDKCLNCHKKIAIQMKQHKGLHGGIKVGYCSTCHNEHSGLAELKGSLEFKEFDHDRVNFSIKGHKKQSCAVCHNRKYSSFNPANCKNCHLSKDKQFQRHVSKFGEDCLDCHDGISNKFEHAREKWFFKSKHVRTKCNDCHKNDSFSRLETGCLSCHKSVHKAKIGQNCLSCHDMGSWDNVRFRHSAKSACLTCHDSPSNHFGATCLSCHSLSSWKSVKVDHSAASVCYRCHQSPTGHFGQNCASCHNRKSWAEANFKHSLNSSNCSSCHRKPINHYGMACNKCHNTSGWKNATFSHSSSGSCVNCHSAPRNHFSNACSSCHSPSKSWGSATFSHPGIEEHSYTSFSCGNCHPNGYQSSSCTKCHSGNPSEDKHRNKIENDREKDDDD